MPNLKVSIVEKVKLASGKWTNLPVRIPKSKPNGKGLYLKDSRDGNFYLLWREGGQRKYHPVHGALKDAMAAKERKELYLAGIAKGLHVEDPSVGNIRLTVAAGIDEYLNILTGRGNTVALHTFALRVALKELRALRGVARMPLRPLRRRKTCAWGVCR